jgi:hypothetical protein
VVRTGRQYRALILALLVSPFLWHLPFGGLVLYPFKLFATWIHELSHGVVMAMVGAGFDRMEIFRDTSGYAYSVDSTGRLGAALVSCAGYMGTAVFGAGLLIAGRTRKGARYALIAIGLALALSGVVFVSNGFGRGAVGVGAVAFLMTALVAGPGITGLLLNFVAAQSCINAVLDIRVLFRTSLVVNGEVMQGSDAHNMARAAFGTHWLWAAVWLAWSFLLFYLALRVTRRDQPLRLVGVASAQA